MRAFVSLHKMIDLNKELSSPVDQFESKYDEQFRMVFEALQQLIAEEEAPYNPIGFKNRI